MLIVSPWWRSLRPLLTDRLDQLGWTLAKLKQRLRQALNELLQDSLLELVHGIVAATINPPLSSDRPRLAAPGPTPRADPWWADEAKPSSWSEPEGPWQPDDEEEAAPSLQAHGSHPKLTASLEVGCEATACLLQGWPRPVPTAVAWGIGMAAAGITYLTQPWLGVGLTLATSALQMLRLMRAF